MYSFARNASIAALLSGAAGPAFADQSHALDPVAPQVIYQSAAADFSGWYIRGDLGYLWSDFRGATYTTYSPPSTNDFDFGNFDDGWTFGGGVGYQINKYLRTDVTANWLFESGFTGQTSDGVEVSVDTSAYSALLLLANAYVDIGTWYGVTPYVGGGIGGAWVKWDDLNNTIDPGNTTVHRGGDGWRFAYALSAGASYCLTDQLKFDAGYRFSHIQGGRMFEYTDGTAGPGYDDGIFTHEVRGGLRYQFGKSDCSAPEAISYEAAAPLYTK